MKKFLSLCAAFCVFFSFFAQNVHYDYQDGLVVFQLKQHSKVINTISSSSRVVDFKSEPIFKTLNQFQIVEVLRLHPNIEDEKLRRTYQIQLQDIYIVDEVIRILQTNPNVEYAELKELHRTFLTPNDLGANATNNAGTSPTTNQWSLHKIQAQQAWDIGTGDANVVVAVTDDAFKIDHVDLVNKLVDPYDAVTQSSNPAPCGTNAGNHGTHVAGTVGAHTNNGTGVASIGFNVSLMPIKIGNCNNQLTHGYEGITYAADKGAHVVNMSWGGGGFSNYGQNVCNYAWNQGTILVAAAGNNNASTVFYPAGYNNVIAVASTTPTDARSSFSQYGTWVNIAAPGSNIRSTYATSLYNSISGTSMASPHVAGLMGLMRSVAPNATNTDLINCLYSGADNINAQNPSFIGQLGAGRINAYNSMVCAAQYAAEHDAAIIDVLSPSSTLCSGTFQPIVTLRNFGSATLTSATVSYNWGGANQTFNWTGSLTTGNSEDITLPEITIADGDYTFEASTSQPNGVADQNPTNDLSEIDFSIDNNGQIVSLSVLTDCWGSETTWQVVNDDNGQVVASGGPYPDGEPLGENTHNFCLPTGCYTFTIFDVYGDGMNGSQWQTCSVDGDYFMQYEDGTQIFEMTAVDADFGASASHPFCIIPENNFDDAGISQIVSPNLFSCGTTISPVVRLRNYGLNTLTSTTILYTIFGSAQQTFNWTGSLASGQTLDVTLPEVTGTVGTSTFTATTNQPNGVTDNNPSNNSAQISFAVNNNPAALPFVESFETDVIANGSWKTLNPDSDVTWNRVTVGGISPGTNAMKMDLFNYVQAGQRDGLISPPVSLQGYASAEMTFHHAYRRFNQTATDSLIVYVSTNCGTSWIRVFQIAENGNGTFATQVTSAVAFTPAQPQDWCIQPISAQTPGASCYEVDLTPFAGEDIVVMFESYNAGTLGNNLFIDNINITGTPDDGMPVANFNSSNTSICPGESVQFNNASSADVTSWSWSFPGGTPATSSSPNPVITYNAAGTYNVSLTVTNDSGTTSTTQNNLVVVSTAPITPTITQNGNVLSVFLLLGDVATWFLDNVQVGTGASLTIDTPGNYSVEVVNSAGCRSTSNELTVLSTENLEMGASIVIYPNPSNSVFQIQLDQVEIQKITVIDALGRIVKTESNIQPTTSLDLQNLNSGIYTLVLIGAEAKYFKKIELLK